MQKHRIRFSSDDDVRSQKSRYTNVNKKIDSISSKNVELSLEVELDDEVRSIIKHPDKCPSALLDVTVIKPKGIDQFTKKTQILKTDQVKHLLECMTLDTTEKRHLMRKLFGVNEIVENGAKQLGKSSCSSKECRRKSCLSTKCKHNQSPAILGHDDIKTILENASSLHAQKYSTKETIHTKVQQIYTTPRTYENIRTMFECKNKEKENHESDKMNQPCLCQNCAIVGILTDSQKKPFATEVIPDLVERKESKFRRLSRKKSVSFKHPEDLPTSSRSHDQCQAIFKLLSTRITELEQRLMVQEQKAVPKDYFKKIITKLVNHVSKLTHYTTEERNLSTMHRAKDPLSPSDKYKSTTSKYNKYYVNPVLTQNARKFPAEKEYEPKPCSSSEPARGPSDTIWKWGEEFLTSGRDLKNKVIILLEETLRNLKKGWEKEKQDDRPYEGDIQTVVDELSKNLTRTLKASSSRINDPKVIPLQVNKLKNSNLSTITSATNQRVFLERRLRKPSLIPRFKKRRGPAVNVAYINPLLTSWPEESSVSFKIDTSDYESNKGNMSEARKHQYKKDFLRVLENTKTTDKFKLWQNIWNQALESRQSKNDTVTIQIPDPKDPLRKKMIYLDYTIGELERLLLRDQNRSGGRR